MPEKKYIAITEGNFSAHQPHRFGYRTNGTDYSRLVVDQDPIEVTEMNAVDFRSTVMAETAETVSQWNPHLEVVALFGICRWRITDGRSLVSHIVTHGHEDGDIGAKEYMNAANRGVHVATAPTRPQGSGTADRGSHAP